VGNLPSWEDLESQADEVADDIFSGVESSLTPISDSDLDFDGLRPESLGQEENLKEEEDLVGRLKQLSREEWMLLGTAVSSVVVAGSLWMTIPQINPNLRATAKEAPASPSPAATLPTPTVAAAPIPANTTAAKQEEKILQRYKQNLQAAQTALGTKAGNKANPFFPSVKISQSSSVAALPPGAQRSQPSLPVAKGQTPPVQFAQPVAQAAAQPAQFKVVQPLASVPQRYNIPPLPRILPAPPHLRPLRGNGALPPAPPSNQIQTAAPSPAPVNTPTAAPTTQSATAQSATTRSIENPQVSANNPNSAPQVKQTPQTVASAAPTHSLMGIMGTGSKRQTALIKSGDSMREVLPGEQLGGGWTLQSIAENQVTLQQQGGQTKVLTLGDP
jgi:hypothetical protein